MRFLIVTAILASSAAAAQTTLPDYDVDARCDRYGKSVPNPGAGGAALYTKQCLQEEQRGYDILKLEWPNVSEKGKAACLKIKGAPFFYSALSQCIMGALSVERQQRSFNEQGPFRR